MGPGLPCAVPYEEAKRQIAKDKENCHTYGCFGRCEICAKDKYWLVEVGTIVEEV